MAIRQTAKQLRRMAHKRVDGMTKKELLEFLLHFKAPQPDPAEPERWPKYEGFGRSLTCREWSQVLGVHRSTIIRHLKRGETIEQIAAEVSERAKYRDE